jgi:hypothetical protein
MLTIGWLMPPRPSSPTLSPVLYLLFPWLCRVAAFYKSFSCTVCDFGTGPPRFSAWCHMYRTTNQNPKNKYDFLPPPLEMIGGSLISDRREEAQYFPRSDVLALHTGRPSEGEGRGTICNTMCRSIKPLSWYFWTRDFPMYDGQIRYSTSSTFILNLNLQY